MKLLTIGMPVFNDVNFIEQSITSVVQQTFDDFILIISDDGSTDGSAEICKKYANQDDRIIYIRQEKNLGISRNMEFLLSQATTKYFMWAGDDDLYAKDFVKTLIDLLENNKHVVSAFSICALIDEKNNIVTDSIAYDYSNPDTYKRLQYFIKNSSDYFGYGIFKREEIKDVKFPVWWWINKKTPYNNIFPTLCYYLAKGDFVLSPEKLFYKRVKTEINTNHLLVGKNNAIKESFAYWLRRFNLFCFSVKLIYKATDLKQALFLTPNLFYYWFVVPSWEQFLLACKSPFKNRIKK
jgi:glycosyltransferase involved in cell wall biosynthesis